MTKSVTCEQIRALRVEAAEARELAKLLSDGQSVADLQSYASELETEAGRMELAQEFSVARAAQGRSYAPELLQAHSGRG